MRYQQPHGWLVLDDSGSMMGNEHAIRLAQDIREQFRDTGVTLDFFTTSTKGCHPTAGIPTRLGDGGGDGTRDIFEKACLTRGDNTPSFIIYLTDGEPCLDNNLAVRVVREKMLIVDVTGPKITGIPSFSDKAREIFEALLHDGDCPDACDCIDDSTCDCGEEDECEFEEYHHLWTKQPWFPNWSRWFPASKADWARAMADRMGGDFFKILADQHFLYLDELTKRRSPFKHPVDKDLDEINRNIDAHKGTSIQTRAQLACEVNLQLKKILGGNSLTPAQHERIRATKYRMYTELLNLTHQQSIGATYGKDGDKMAAYMERIRRCRHLTDPIKRNSTAIEIYRDLNRDNVFPGRTELLAEVGQEFFNMTPSTPTTEVQEGHHMTTQITTTVSLKVHSRHQATLADLKALITEVERVGGTDESYVNLESAYRNGCFDAVVVTARQEPEVDPRVEAAASIEDLNQRVSALLDLNLHHPHLRLQIEKALTGTKPAKTTAKKTTQTKA